MTTFATLEEALEEYPILSRAGRGLHQVGVKLTWAVHEVESYTKSQDVADLVAAEEIVQEIAAEVPHILKSLAGEIRREDENLLEARAACRRQDEKEDGS